MILLPVIAVFPTAINLTFLPCVPCIKATCIWYWGNFSYHTFRFSIFFLIASSPFLSHHHIRMYIYMLGDSIEEFQHCTISALPAFGRLSSDVSSACDRATGAKLSACSSAALGPPSLDTSTSRRIPVCHTQQHRQWKIRRMSDEWRCPMCAWLYTYSALLVLHRLSPTAVSKISEAQDFASKSRQVF